MSDNSGCCPGGPGWPEMVDAKLSTAARKKLSGGTFCGPGRSFPIPDCAHVTAARRLIGRYKGSAATKAKILSCVSRKAKSLGCAKKKGDSITEEKINTIIASEAFESAIELLAFLEVLEEEKAPEQKRIDQMKENASATLTRLRFRHKGEKPTDEDLSMYLNRSLESIFDSIEDELSQIDTQLEKE